MGAGGAPESVLAAMAAGARAGIVRAVEQTPTQEFDPRFDLTADSRKDEDELVRAWREEQLTRLGLLPGLARVFANCVDWHDIASLVARGCPPMLALEIVR
jgi:hypothetical protein